MPTADLTRAGSVLAVNAGSTGVKLSLVDEDDRITPLRALADALDRPVAIGHRIVFGGSQFTAPVVIDDGLARELVEHSAVAPLHNAPALRLINEARTIFGDVPHVAVFDTAFHATLPDEAVVYPVPEAWRSNWDVRRHGFHGLSVEWAAERASEILGPSSDDLRMVICHLGGGASATAVRGGCSIDTSMGFSPLEGLVMATRSGSLDPDIPLHLILNGGITPQEVQRMLNQDSGMVALTGTADMREVEARAQSGDEPAQLALAVHDHRLAGTVAAMAASLGGLDVVVFTGGVGEGSARVRAQTARRLAFLGMDVNPERNANPDGDADISSVGASVRTLVVRAREEIVIARAVRRMLASAATLGGAA